MGKLGPPPKNIQGLGIFFRIPPISKSEPFIKQPKGPSIAVYARVKCAQLHGRKADFSDTVVYVSDIRL